MRLLQLARWVLMYESYNKYYYQWEVYAELNKNVFRWCGEWNIAYWTRHVKNICYVSFVSWRASRGVLCSQRRIIRCLHVRTGIAYMYHMYCVHVCVYMYVDLNRFKLGGMYEEHVSSGKFMSCRSYSLWSFYALRISSSDALSHTSIIQYISVPTRLFVGHIMLQFICCLLISLTHCSGLDHETTPGMLHLTHLLVYASLFSSRFFNSKIISGFVV